MRIYLAGPMTGIEEWNYPLFRAETVRLRALGHRVVSPAEINAGHEVDGWVACMKRDIVALLDCDALALLPGWEKSKGARGEVALANLLDIPALDAASFSRRADE